ncbi:unnamed protein product [Prunus armeniaca]
MANPLVRELVSQVSVLLHQLVKQGRRGGNIMRVLHSPNSKNHPSLKMIHGNFFLFIQGKAREGTKISSSIHMVSQLSTSRWT